MLKQLMIIIGFLVLAQAACTYMKTSKETVLKSYEITALDSLIELGQKPIVVFLHTDWCKYCQNMKHTTFKEESIINRLNKNFYFISFNGEYGERIMLNNHIFKPTRNGNRFSNHELAYHLGSENKKLTYPAVVILEKNGNRTLLKNHFMTTQDMTLLLSEVTKRH